MTRSFRDDLRKCPSPSSPASCKSPASCPHSPVVSCCREPIRALVSQMMSANRAWSGADFLVSPRSIVVNANVATAQTLS